MTRHILTLIAVLFFHAPVWADWINLSGAENAPTIAEIHINDDHVRIDLEIFVKDMVAFDRLIPDSFFKDSDFKSYKQSMKTHKSNPDSLIDDDAYREYFTRYWRGNQMSDHYPVWIQLNIDSTDDFLHGKLKQL